MTISYTLQPVPDWYFPDLVGNPLAGGKMYTYSSLDPTQSKPVYQDPAGTNQWPNPVIFNENGTSGPFYWKLDSTDADDLYFIQIFDANNNLVYQIDQYPISGGGGGGTINTVQKIENIIVNSSFLHNIDETTVQPIADQTYLAPGAHSGLYFKDINFIQTGASDAQDTITFDQFATGTNPISPDFAPAYFLNYTCLNNPVGETLKGIRIPIAPFVNTVANQTFTFTFWARANGGGANTLDAQVFQYFGTGGTGGSTPSASVSTSITTPITITGSFDIYSINFTIPSAVGKTVGNSNDDATYIDILLPLSAACDIDIAKPALYAGSLFPNTFYESVEEIEAKIETPRTGDVRIKSNPFSNNPKDGIQSGWVPLNDGTIGNTSSNSTTRAKEDSWLLFDTLWNNTISANCPIYDSTGAVVVKGGSSLSDWNSDRQLQLPRTLGRALLDRGTGTVSTSTYTADATTNIFTLATPTTYKTGDAIMLSGGSAPTPLSNGVTYYAYFISTTQMYLAYSAEAAIAASVIDIAVNGSGTLTTPPNYALAGFLGESQHELNTNEMPSHFHTTTINANNGSGGPPLVGLVGNGSTLLGNITYNSSSTGGSYPHNNVQPSSYWNMIIKL